MLWMEKKGKLNKRSTISSFLADLKKPLSAKKSKGCDKNTKTPKTLSVLPVLRDNSKPHWILTVVTNLKGRLYNVTIILVYVRYLQNKKNLSGSTLLPFRMYCLKEQEI